MPVHSRDAGTLNTFIQAALEPNLDVDEMNCKNQSIKGENRLK